MKYKKLTGIILKKQNYREADQILTLWTQELGKVRVLGRALRLPKSKLAYSLADLSCVEIDVAGGKFIPVVISARSVHSFRGLRQDLKKTATGLYAAELMMKMTADEHPNEPAFDLLKNFLKCLEKLDYSKQHYPLLESFALKLLDCLGFSMEHAESTFKIPATMTASLAELYRIELSQIDRVCIVPSQTEQLHKVINTFVEFVLERNIKSESFLMRA